MEAVLCKSSRDRVHYMKHHKEKILKESLRQQVKKIFKYLKKQKKNVEVINTMRRINTPQYAQHLFILVLLLYK
jgi:hypothetical protein